MSVGGAVAAGAAGGVKKGFKWWAMKVGLAVGGSLVVGGIIAGVLAFSPIGLAIGAAVATLGILTAFSFGGLIAGAGFLKGSADGTSKYLKNEQSMMQQQTQQIAADNDMRRQNLQEMAMMNPGAPEDGRYAAMEAARRQAPQNPSVPPLRG